MADNEDDGEWSPWEKEEVGEGSLIGVKDGVEEEEEEEEEPEELDYSERQPLVSSGSQLLQVCNWSLLESLMAFEYFVVK